MVWCCRTWLMRVRCKKHPDTFLMPSREKSGWKTGCWRCTWESIKRNRPKREERWRTTFIPCARHPERRCNRAHYVIVATRRCRGCLHFKSDGSRGASHRRHRERCRRSWNFKRSMKRRLRGGFDNASLTGFRLFARITGYMYGD